MSHPVTAVYPPEAYQEEFVLLAEGRGLELQISSQFSKMLRPPKERTRTCGHMNNITPEFNLHGLRFKWLGNMYM